MTAWAAPGHLGAAQHEPPLLYGLAIWPAPHASAGPIRAFRERAVPARSTPPGSAKPSTSHVRSAWKSSPKSNSWASRAQFHADFDDRFFAGLADTTAARHGKDQTALPHTGPHTGRPAQLELGPGLPSTIMPKACARREAAVTSMNCSYELYTEPAKTSAIRATWRDLSASTRGS